MSAQGVANQEVEETSVEGSSGEEISNQKISALELMQRRGPIFSYQVPRCGAQMQDVHHLVLGGFAAKTEHDGRNTWDITDKGRELLATHAIGS